MAVRSCWPLTSAKMALDRLFNRRNRNPRAPPKSKDWALENVHSSIRVLCFVFIAEGIRTSAVSRQSHPSWQGMSYFPLHGRDTYRKRSICAFLKLHMGMIFGYVGR